MTKLFSKNQEGNSKTIRTYGEWDYKLEEVVKKLGGWINAHTHLDRANTFGKKYFDHVNLNPEEAAQFSLEVKQDFVGNLHTGLAYQSEDLYQRMKSELERAVSLGVREIISFIDVTPDIGLRAIEIAAELKKEFQEKITFKIAAYPIFGFSKPGRWEIFKEGAKIADILGGLPSRDARKGGIGADEHIKKIIILGQELGKEVHLHVDQNNDPDENETERLIEAVHWLGSPKVEDLTGPTVWAIHVISPSCYEENRFQKLIEGLLRNNIGVICCPSASISMYQIREKVAPIHNSIARILDMAIAGVPVKIGTDNICDIFIPSGDGKVESEIWLASNLLRFYNVQVWAKIGAGIPLNNVDRDIIRRSRS